jgi:hypothetical protein
VKLLIAATVGVPEMLPVEAFNDAQPGNEPAEMLHVSGGTQLAVFGVVAYGTPTVPPGSVVVVIEQVPLPKLTVTGDP